MRASRYKNLRREHLLSYDAQLSLLLSLGMAVVPHVVRIPVWMTLFACTVIIYQLATLYFSRLSLPKSLIVILGFTILISVSLHYATIFGRDAGVSLLIGMLFIKLLETRRYRDAMVMIGLSYFVILTNLLYTQSIPTSLYMILVVFIITVSLVTINSSPGAITWKEKIRIALPLTILALPLAVLLFILFPRIPGPLWGLPQDVYNAHSGMSDTMSPGSLSQLALSDEVAFRVSFNGPMPAKEDLYWRALVLWEFDGRTWREGDVRANTPPNIQPKGNPVEYTVTLEPHQRRWLFALDIPSVNSRSKAPTGLRMTVNRDALLRASNSIVTLSQYRVNSFSQYTLDPALNVHDRVKALRLPPYNPETARLAQSWRNNGLSAEQIINKALSLFRQEFTYTLRPPVLRNNIVDEFLFDTKRGFCEHFAGAFVVLMRAAGIPARVIIGYQGGEVNPIGNYMLVRQADAHAWSEVWLENSGWVRIDPTSAVSPLRIEHGLDQAIPAFENPRFILRRNSKLLAKLGLLWDSVNNRWNQWILGYGPEMQQLFLQYLGIQNTAAYNLVIILSVTLTVVMSVIALIGFRKRRPPRRDYAQRMFLKLCKKLTKAGFKKQPYDGASTYLECVKKKNEDLGDDLAPIIALYLDLRYRQPQMNPGDLKRFRKSVRELNPIKYSNKDKQNKYENV